MNLSVDIELLQHRIAGFDPSSATDPTEVQQRVLSFYSAAIAVNDETALDLIIDQGIKHKVTRAYFYEIVLQSYLFLGFPRMLQAAAHLDSRLPESNNSKVIPVSAEETADWFERGKALCRKIYGGNYERLKSRVESFAPEIFRWMIFEGYGKVLSRPLVEVSTRELAVIACLTIENMEPQLLSHVKGALNVGVPGSLIVTVIEDIGPAAGDGYETSKNIIRKLGLN